MLGAVKKQKTMKLPADNFTRSLHGFAMSARVVYKSSKNAFMAYAAFLYANVSTPVKPSAGRNHHYRKIRFIEEPGYRDGNDRT